MSIDKKASKFLPQDVQDAINTFMLYKSKGIDALWFPEKEIILTK